MAGEAGALGRPDLQVPGSGCSQGPCSPDTHVTDTHTRRHMVDTTRALSENIRFQPLFCSLPVQPRASFPASGL